MINLLDRETQRHYRAARLNLRLREYFVAIGVTVLTIVLLFGIGVLVTRNERSAAEKELRQGQESVAAYSKVRKEAESFSDNLKMAKSILGQEVLYSDMIVRIAKTLPSTAVLSSLQLDQTTLAKPITLAGRVKTKEDAVTLKNTLENSPLFDHVNINNINEETINAQTKGIRRDYPVSVTLSMNVTKGQEGSLMP